jgi:dTDP-4-dehydrorhamnose reductase
MARIAITGSTGFVGSNIAESLMLLGHSVVGLTRNRSGYNASWLLVDVDYSSDESISRALDGADAVVHCAIADDFRRLLNDRAAAYDNYVGLTERLARTADGNGQKFIFISTDWVMDGTGHRELESNHGNAINYYGYLKGLAEQAVHSSLEGRGVVARVAGVMGRHRIAEAPRLQDVGFGFYVDTLVRSLRAGKEFQVWGGPNVNQITTPSLASEAGAQIGRIIDRDATGTFHLVGDTAVTRMELAYATCDVFELPRHLITEGEPPAVELFPGPVPVDSSLGNDYTKSVLGIVPQPLEDLLGAFRREIDSGVVSPLTSREL